MVNIAHLGDITVRRCSVKKALVGLVLLASFGFTSNGMAQETYLVKINQITPEAIQSLSDAGIRVYAKTADFFVAEASSDNLSYLQKEKISFQVLDDEPEYSLYYFIWAKAKESISLYLDKIKVKAIVLDMEGNQAIVKGQPRRIEELTSFGLSLKLIGKRPLPLKPEQKLPVLAGAKALAYHPVIDSIVDRVTTSELTGWVGDLSGQHSVIIGGLPYTIATRYTDTQGCNKAAQFIKEKFESFGLSAWYDTFYIYPFYYGMDVIARASGDTAWIGCLYSGIWKTSDAGNNWKNISGTESYQLWALSAPSPDTLYGVGNVGLIIKSTDRGESWLPLSSPTTQSLRGTYFEDSQTGWVTGYAGTIFLTTDGGTTWSDQTTGSSNLYEITFADSNNGWIVGQNGSILHTTDKGTNWLPQISGASGIIFGLDFVTPDKGWVCGQNGYIAYTTNAGANWNTQTSNTAQALYMVSAPDSLKVWAAGLGGTILRTTDAGTNWTQQASAYADYYEVMMLDAQKGWVTGYNEILHTSNGGTNWVSQINNLNSKISKFNVVAALPGQTEPGKECLITAHYDNTSENPSNIAPGADDNASGTAAVLAAAHLLKDYGFNYTVKFVGFAGEEQGLVGSDVYAEKARLRGDTIIGVYNFDMIAWEGNGDSVIELHSGTEASSQALADLMIGVINDYGLSLVPQKITTGATNRSDHASFWAQGYPAILGIEDFDDFNPYYHSTNDLISAFDLPYFTGFAKAGIASVATLAGPIGPGCAAKPGDANASGTYSLADIISTVNYIFNKPGCSPQPLCWLSGQTCQGDWNGSETVTLSDVIQGVNYLFVKPCSGPGSSPACWAPMASGVCCKPYNAP